MKKMIAMILAAGAMSGFAAPTANEDFVVAEDAKTYTNAVQAAKEYTDTAIIAATNAIPSGGGTSSITTNDICNIVTNEVSDGWSEWHYEWYNVETGVHFPTNFSQITWNGSAWEKPSDFPQFMWPPMEGDITDANVSYFIFKDGLENGINATRSPITRNALGLARITYLPPLTNDVPFMISSAAQAATNYTDETTIAAINANNPAFVAAVTNCPVVIAAADGTNLGEFGEYGTLGALLAALAAAITWLKANKVDATALPYALVSATVNNGTASLADRAINAVSLSESATLAFPAQTAGKARDFVVRLTLTKTNNVVPSVTFPADVAYETEGGEWPDLTEAGTYIVRLTEVPTAGASETARFFLQCSSAVADAMPPSAGGGV